MLFIISYDGSQVDNTCTYTKIVSLDGTIYNIQCLTRYIRFRLGEQFRNELPLHGLIYVYKYYDPLIAISQSDMIYANVFHVSWIFCESCVYIKTSFRILIWNGNKHYND
jgi:hypothetical protein